eukprot:GHVR01027255.1.p1 GENE.GHVR01027255.1~~GHVR01027255.1.p1  ORF type:complete len:154 (+),score=2.90 GHVR01027255.1:463-924(+)
MMKLLDTYKRGHVNFVDWIKFINGSDINWIANAKQQIGIFLSKTYQNLSDAFLDITKGDQKLLFTIFDKWIRNNSVLSGFMINDDILKHIFSSFDCHKKGYILENDFIAIFGGFNWKAEQTLEFLDNLKTKFKSCLEAYRCMISYDTKTQLDF